MTILPDLCLKDAFDDDQLYFRCGCMLKLWPVRDGKRAVRLDACDWERHGKPILALVENVRFVKEELLQVCWDEEEIPGEFIYVHENLAPLQEME